ncbi:MAG: RNA 2',3'-cyclic phosphodiesterase [Gammaproteobacteria bacterium]|nr:RNA 2',3'-cyclic phosphodiesterase [Gammaproteobacteria bacterium]
MPKLQTTSRLFFAIDLPASVKTRLMDIQHSISIDEARLVQPENFHITLSFLGKVYQDQMDQILTHFTDLELAPFEVKTDQLIFWPGSKILAIGIDGQQQQLLACKKQIEYQLSQLNIFQYDKKDFVPHITLFRQVTQIDKLPELSTMNITVDRISLMESRPHISNQQYQTVESWRLINKSVKQQLLGR